MFTQYDHRTPTLLGFSLFSCVYDLGRLPEGQFEDWKRYIFILANTRFSNKDEMLKEYKFGDRNKAIACALWDAGHIIQPRLQDNLHWDRPVGFLWLYKENHLESLADPICRRDFYGWEDPRISVAVA